MRVNIRHLGTQPYHSVWQEMKQFTINRNENTLDELWLLEHPAVYTQGLAGKAEHLLTPPLLPVIQSDRGGQITYHGPGQLIAYLLMDIKRRQLGIRSLVRNLEEVLTNTLAGYGIHATGCSQAPGVYVKNKKIASIGLRVKNGCTYHGIALNVAMDLSPFSRINPCGFATLEMTQVSNYAPNVTMTDLKARFSEAFLTCFEY